MAKWALGVAAIVLSLSPACAAQSSAPLRSPLPDRFPQVSEEALAKGPIDQIFVKQVYGAICEAGIRFPQIVMAQAILETGWFRSPFLMSRRNLFGFKTRDYLQFASLEDSITFYRDWQKRYLPPGPVDYYRFLDEIRYGSPDYTSHLRKIEWRQDCESGSQPLE